MLGLPGDNGEWALPSLSMTPSTQEFLESAERQIIDALGSVLRLGSRVTAVDFPYTTNPGDCAIWLGTRRYLRATNCEVASISDVGRYNPVEISRAAADGPIVLQGGGNLGTLWAEHQDLRLRVIRDFPDRRIVQMPQSARFEDQDSLRVFADAVRGHGDVHIFVRDRASLELLSQAGVDAALCPDMALFMGRLSRPRQEPRTPIMMLARTDHESSGLREWWDSSDRMDNSVELAEWSMSRSDQLRWTAWKTPHRIRRRQPRMTIMSHRAYDAMAQIPFQSAVRQISGARVLITDRLHAHILATLMGIPNFVVDNNYGKLSGIYNLYTKGGSGILCGSFEEAFSRAQDLVR